MPDVPRASSLTIMSTPTLNMELREYQEEAVAEILGRRRQIVAYERGTGKTVIGLQALVDLLNIRLDKPITVLILGNKTAIGVWQDHLQQYAPALWRHTITYDGTPYQRNKKWIEHERLGNEGNQSYRIVLANYSMIAELAKRKSYWTSLIVDEAHKLRNRKTKMFVGAKQLHSEYYWALTGNDVVNRVDDIWTLLHLLDPKRFRGYWKFVEEHCIITTTEYGQEIGQLRNPIHTQQVLAPYVIRKLKQEVLSELPPKNRSVIHVDMNPTQHKLYDDLSEEMIAETQTPEGLHKLVVAPNSLASMTRLRQILVHPLLVDSVAPSAVAAALAEALEADFSEGRSAVVYCPFARALPILSEAPDLPKRLWKGTIRGGMTIKVIGEVVRDFQSLVRPGVLFCSLSMGEGFTATEASVAYFIGFGWNPSVHEQAEDRLHRFGQTKAVDIRYFIHRGTIEEHILDILDRKLTWANQLRDPRGLLKPNSKSLIDST